MAALGATHLVNGRSGDAVAAVREATGGRGVDVALEALGSPVTFRQAVMAVRDGGRAVMVGPHHKTNTNQRLTKSLHK
eukprot:1176209-Prorocentrum_minimum.AAC.5